MDFKKGISLSVIEPYFFLSINATALFIIWLVIFSFFFCSFLFLLFLFHFAIRAYTHLPPRGLL